MKKSLQANSGPEEGQKPVISGKISVTGKGMGFVADPNNPDVDILIEEGFLKSALNGDMVEVHIRGKVKDRITGEVVQIVSRAKTQFVGTIEFEQDHYFLIPDDRKMYTDILIPKEKLTHAKAGDKVLVRMHPWSDAKKIPEGEVLQVIGRKGEHETEIQAIILERGFDRDYPEDVLKEAEAIGREAKTPNYMESEASKRKDFRKTLTFTIDPEDAKDFDDAISLKEMGPERYEIGVHIADVAHFVREGTALDREAEKRGFSLYLVDRTIPMLPEILSNDLCSLNPNEDKLAFSAVFIIEKKGKAWQITDEWFGRTIIHSDKRYSYENAQQEIDSGEGSYPAELRKLNEIAQFLRTEKFNKGAIDFEQDEVKFVLDEKGKPIRVYKKARLDTHKLVEEYMLLANKKVAEFIFRAGEKGGRKSTFIYRTHDLPDREKIAELALFIRALGYELPARKTGVTGKDLQTLFKQIAGKEEESLIKTAAVRSMAKAAYSTSNIGHFGLAFDYYTHFTSPIRRYPDLLVHRLLARHLNGEKIESGELLTYEKKALDASGKEVGVADAERASIKYKQVEYMQERVGQSFNGIITGVTEWGIYVEEVETKAEGMIRLKDLNDDFYTLDPKQYALVGQKKKKKFSLGDKIRFTVGKADLDKKTLDYSLAK